MRCLRAIVCMALAVVTALAPGQAFAQGATSLQTAEVSEDDAVAMAGRIAAACAPDGSLRACNPVKYYDPEDGAKGYIVEYFDNDAQLYGYVVLDEEADGAIAELSWGGQDYLSPYRRAQYVAAENGVALNSTDNVSVLIRLSPWDYALLNPTTATCFTDRGERLTTNEVIMDSPLTSRSTKPEGWEDVFFDDGDLAANYTQVESGFMNGPMFYKSEADTKQITNRYACGVSAMYFCVGFYGAVTDTSNQAYRNDYISLWQKSNTQATGTTQGGLVTTGTTMLNDLGPAVVSFCSDRGKSVSYRYLKNPTFSQFKATTEQNNVAIWGGRPNPNEEGHFMPVLGYRVMQNDSGARIEILSVLDGWDYPLRGLNPNMNYDWTYGTFFSRG